MTEATVPPGDPKRRRVLPVPILAMIVAVAVFAIAGGVWLGVRGPGGGEASGDAIDVPAEGTGDLYAALEDELKAVIEDNPEDLDARRSLAVVLAKMGKHDEAIRQYQEMINADATDDESLYALAILERQTGLTDDALKHLQAAVDISGEVTYLDDLARTSMQVGRYEDAIAAWKRVLEGENLEPQRRAETLGALASAYQDAKMYEEAKAALQEAVALMPEDENLRARLEAMGN